MTSAPTATVEIRPPLSGLPRALRRSLPRRSPWSIHRLADTTVVGMLRSQPLFQHGFGCPIRLDALVDRVRHYPVGREPEPITIAWARRQRIAGIDITRGSFTSPAAESLPGPSRRAHVELLQPAGRAPQDIPVCLMLAATGEQGYTRRRARALPLLRRGVGVLLLENPFYGRRRLPGRSGASPHTVVEQFAMNLATVDEGRALLAWLRAQGHARVGVTGYSQGGMMAAFVAATVNFPVAAIPRGAGCSAASIFTEGGFARALNWRRLATELGSQRAAREHLRHCLGAVDVRRYPAPRCPGAAILVGARDDAIVPEPQIEALHRHWPGSELRWLRGGHLTSGLLDRGSQGRAIVDAFERLTRLL